jgi:hypothetical protein
MRRMLCKNGKDLEVSFYDIIADSEKGLVKWEETFMILW